MKMKSTELKPSDDKRVIVLAIYDITDNKRRGSMVKCLQGYGIRVQKSCFEGFLTPRQCLRMEKEASRLIDEHEDSFRVYIIQNKALVKSWGRGEVNTDDVIIY